MAVTVAPTRRAGRVTRSPRHTFLTTMNPYVLTPFLLAPVLPGETLKSALLQVRAVTDPVRNPLVGWHLEHYLFYVKHRDLDIRDDLAEMMLDPEGPFRPLWRGIRRHLSRWWRYRLGAPLL